MGYESKLADKVRDYLYEHTDKTIEEKRMFGGLAFMVDGKMCINISDDRLMCRYDVSLQAEVTNKFGFIPMIMKGKNMSGYCYVEPEGFRKQADFNYWVDLCLSYNPKAKASKKKKSDK